MSEPKTYVVHTPLYPLYSEVRCLIKICRDSVSNAALLELINAVWDQTGTPQNPVDWSKPDEWIDERLQEKSKKLAHLIWSGSNKTVNPRHVYGSYLFINSYKLLLPDATGVFRITARGEKFLSDERVVVRELDEAEGLPQLLGILAAHSPAKRGDLLSEWGEFLLSHSKYGTSSTIKDTLRRRILNLVERGFVTRDGNTYTIGEKGVAYAADVSTPAAQQPHQQVSYTTPGAGGRGKLFSPQLKLYIDRHP